MPTKLTLAALPCDDWERRSAHQSWQPAFRQRVARPLGLWLAWSSEPPEADTLEAFAGRVRQELTPRSAATHALLVGYAAPLVWPERDWRWLRHAIAGFQPSRTTTAKKNPQARPR